MTESRMETTKSYLLKNFDFLIENGLKGKLYQSIFQEGEKELLMATLKKLRGNVLASSRLFGMDRVLLTKKINFYGINPKEFKL